MAEQSGGGSVALKPLILVPAVITLAIRVLLSASLVAFLVFSYWMGWISPSGLR